MCSPPAIAMVYHIGEGLEYTAIGDVPLESIKAGDSVMIHFRAEPYCEKWVISATGTAAAPIVFSGVPSQNGTLPVIDGSNAVTRKQLDYWNEPRSVVKIGGSSKPSAHPEYIIIENLDIRSGRPSYTFTDDAGSAGTYAENAAAIHLEEGDNITIRNCMLHDCGNGFFCGSGASNVIVECCHIYDNGIEGSIYEHNNYTEAHGIIFQFNYFGYLREGCDGNNLKDRSGDCVIRYNWIEGGNRQLDLVDSDYESIYGEASYNTTYVYGNILIEPDNHGNSQIVHYGGDSGEEERYRKGTLHFYHNTIVSTRDGNTTLLRLSSNDERADVRNNIIFTTAPGNRLAICASDGTVLLRNNWLKTGWRVSHDNSNADVRDSGGNIPGDTPGFAPMDTVNYFYLEASSPCVNKGTELHEQCAAFPVQFEYVNQRRFRQRPQDGAPDIGAFEYGDMAIDHYRPRRQTRPIEAHFNGRELIVNSEAAGEVICGLYTALGQRVALLRQNAAGNGYAVFSLGNSILSPGDYIVRLKSGSRRAGVSRVFVVAW